MVAEPLLQLYSREGCHLCEDLAADLRLFQQELGFAFEVIDIDADAGLRARYHASVPVLVYAGQQICQYYLDPVALKRVLAPE